MIIYSKKIIAFVSDIKNIIKDILVNEVHLKVVGNRFYNKKQTISYPIHIAIYHSKGVLGYFDSSFYELGFNECLKFAQEDLLKNIIRHELAHYLTFIERGNVAQPHGPEFKECCEKLMWGEEVYRASICLENRSEGQEESSVLRKVKKLMALGSSSNKNEQEQAVIKSQQLLLKHNIEPKYVEGDEEVYFLKRIMKQGKKTAKMCAIGRILETFYVSIVYHRASDGTYLEILGDKVGVEIAEYVAGVLNIELENFWEQTPKPAHKNSFFLGIAKGYCHKIENLKKDYSIDVNTALIVVEKKLCEARNMAYKILSNTRSSGKYCGKSSAMGEQIGKQLNIHPAIQSVNKILQLN